MGRRKYTQRYRYTQEQRAEAERVLRDILKPGMCVYTALKHVSRMGLTRAIDVYIVDYVGEIVNISYWVAIMLNWPRDERTGAVKVTGTGADMGYHLVLCLGRALWPDGVLTNPFGLPTEGTYALKHKWL